MKFAPIIGSYGWGGKTVKQITGMLNNLKVEMIEPVIVKDTLRKTISKLWIDWRMKF